MPKYNRYVHGQRHSRQRLPPQTPAHTNRINNNHGSTNGHKANAQDLSAVHEHKLLHQCPTQWGISHGWRATEKNPGTATSCHPTGQLQERPQRNLKYPTKTSQGAAIGAAALSLRRRRARQQRRNPSGRRMPASAFLVSRRVSKSRLVAKRQRLRQYSIKRREPRMFSRRRTQTLAFHVRPRRSCASQSGPGRCDGRKHRPGTWGGPTRDAAPRQEVQARYRNACWRDDARGR